METGITVRCAIPRIHNDRLEWLVDERLANDYQGGCLEFPGGVVKMNEEPVAALIREFKEEIGIVISNPQWVHTTEGKNTQGKPTNSWQMLFSTKEFSGEPITNRNEVAQVLWVPDQELRLSAITRLTRHWLDTLPFFKEGALLHPKT